MLNTSFISIQTPKILTQPSCQIDCQLAEIKHLIIAVSSRCVTPRLTSGNRIEISSFDFEKFTREQSLSDYLQIALNYGFAIRRGAVWATPIGHSFAIKHPPIKPAIGNLSANWNSAAFWNNEAIDLFWRYLITLWAHVFEDGNGRMARIQLASAIKILVNDPSKVNFTDALIVAETMHAMLKNQIVVMQSQNSYCWLSGYIALLNSSLPLTFQAELQEFAKSA